MEHLDKLKTDITAVIYLLSQRAFTVIQTLK